MRIFNNNYIKGFIILTMIFPLIINGRCCKKFKRDVCVCNRLSAYDLFIRNNASICKIWANYLKVCDLLVKNDATINGDLSVEGDETIAGDLVVTGTITANSDLFVLGDETIYGDLVVEGDETIGGDLFVTGTITAGDLVVIGTITAVEFIGPNGPISTTGGIVTYGSFYALMDPDNPTAIAVGAAIEFPQDGPATGIARSSDSEFVLPNDGIYEVTWQASVTEAGQLILALDAVELASTVVGRATGTNQIIGSTLIVATAGAVLTVRNPSGNAAALTLTVDAGGTHPVSATLTIKQIA